VLGNLVSNAIRYTPLGGHVTVAVWAGPGQSPLVIEVTDTGRGINEDDLPHLFDRFYRADMSRSRATGGSGLGLSIARHLVEAHGGSINVASTVGSGSRFSIELPNDHPVLFPRHGLTAGVPCS
jgi:two-component system sensor histidine kinase BaeS